MRNCVCCGEQVALARWALAIHMCLVCGEKHARQRKFTIVPMHKSNYVPVFNRQDLVGINSKGGNQRYF
jgi:ribosomal protein L37AE/L43A